MRILLLSVLSLHYLACAGPTPQTAEDSGTDVARPDAPSDDARTITDASLDALDATRDAPSNVDAARAPTCVTNGRAIWAQDPDAGARVRMIDDVTGDGVSEMVSVRIEGPIGAQALTLELGSGVTVVDGPDFYLVSVLGGDVDADGRADLIVGLPWQDEVRVFPGPVRGVMSWNDAPIRIRAPSDGLASLFGIGLVLIDANRDGTTDIVITAPGEGEEACFGQRATRVFFGPFAPGVYVAGMGTIELPGPMRVCLGESVRCATRGTALGIDIDSYYPLGDAGSDRCVRYELPFSEATPLACVSSDP